MSFYKNLSTYYDVLFRPGEAQLTFIASRTKPGGKVLDVGCGTGTYAIPLAVAGYRVSAFDLDPAMIERMDQKSDTAQVAVNGFEMDMRLLHKIIEGNFDTIMCIGNTLAHLPDPEALAKFCDSAYDKLKPGGKLLIQIVNYDRIFEKEISELPEMDRPEAGVKFIREYEYKDQEVTFIGTLHLPDGTKTVSKVKLYGFTKDVLEKALEDAGFDVAVYGDFRESDFSTETFHLVIDATKQRQ